MAEVCSVLAVSIRQLGVSDMTEVCSILAVSFRKSGSSGKAELGSNLAVNVCLKHTKSLLLQYVL